ncbi:MAG: hypothetical protein OEY94_06770 [Alphaproteobacteria bacterium]|nr:hypothetical protein [Alphaproteobacteria bacterium]
MNNHDIADIETPKITFKSIEGDQVTCAVSPEWKQHLVDFLDYAQEDGRQDVYIKFPEYELGLMRDDIARQVEGSEITIPNYYFLDLFSIFNAFSHLSFDYIVENPVDEVYDPFIFCRLHDDVITITNELYNNDFIIKPRMPALLNNIKLEKSHGG